MQKLLTTVILVVAFLLSAGLVIYLSLKGKEVAVPNLIGKSEGDAERLLEAEGLRLKVRNRTTDEKIQANLVSDQIPNSGTNVKAGQMVSVTISTGIEAKKEDAKATPTPRPAASATPKPKPKPSPSPGDTAGKDKDTAEKKSEGDKGKGTTAVAGKDAGKGETGKPKSTVTPSPKTSPKATPKPSPKKTDN
ncbi:MAG: PASTA domain-containing protein [Acidobacteria bacterium]|nr:PASTA domain-containing protein [Acidobacteriota bacterium]